ncbi:MAG: hypothetical protein HYX76_00400 [Acidobacteria bacterium]|nr:hypothetical protein [Acidobacteriota bacterium]
MAIFLLAIGFRIVSAVLAFLVNVAFPLYQAEQFTIFRRTHVFWDTFARYDSGWYFGIASRGYSYAPGGRSNLAFFPVYPLLMRYVGRLLGGRQEHYYLAGVLISWVAFAVAMVLLYRLARLDLDRRAALRAPLYAAIFPFAFFFGLVYSESLFLMLTLAAFYGLRRSRWLAGGLAGALAAATRVNGILALPALAWAAWTQAGRNLPALARATVALALVAGGLAAYSAYVYSITGSPLEWASIITRWGYYPGGAPWTSLVRLLANVAADPYGSLAGNRDAFYEFVQAIGPLMLIAALPFIWMRLGTPYGLFIVANLWLPFSSGAFEGLGRYSAVLFPFSIWLATFESRVVQAGVTVTFALLYSFCLALFTNIHPIY